MSTNVVYYGMISEKLDCSSETILLESPTEEINLRDLFEEKYPELKDLSYQIAVNQEFTETLASGIEVSEIALLPPFAGG
ncbi:MAG: MoaD/ThiS family protein [Crocinitomicaceae bacterium]|nr:MoaD/ThiS family protein [Crocinitomicaceae bacterium]